VKKERERENVKIYYYSTRQTSSRHSKGVHKVYCSFSVLTPHLLDASGQTTLIHRAFTMLSILQLTPPPSRKHCEL
jgi:hypothetical protein